MRAREGTQSQCIWDMRTCFYARKTVLLREYWKLRIKEITFSRWISRGCELQHWFHIKIWLPGREQAGTQGIQGLVKSSPNGQSLVYPRQGKERGQERTNILEEHSEKNQGILMRMKVRTAWERKWQAALQSGNRILEFKILEHRHP